MSDTLHAQVTADCAELREIAEWFMQRGKIETGEFLAQVATRYEMVAGAYIKGGDRLSPPFANGETSDGDHTFNELYDQNRKVIEVKMDIRSKVRILEGASCWMKSRKYWLEDMPDSIDGMNATIIADYTDLPGDDCHYELDLGDGKRIGVNPMWLVPAAYPYINEN